MFNSKKNTATEVTIKTGSVENSSIIGIKGPDIDEFREVFREEIKNLLLQAPQGIPQIKERDPVAKSLFACEFKEASTLGFAVNNSGLLVCPSATGPISSVRQLTSGEVTDAEVIQSRNLLQALKISRSTSGLIPSYTSHAVGLGDQLFAFDRSGERCALAVTAFLTWLSMKRPGGLRRIMIKDVFMASFASRHSLIGGPVINSVNEVVGVAVGAFEAVGALVFKPWSTLEHCIEMGAEEVD